MGAKEKFAKKAYEAACKGDMKLAEVYQFHALVVESSENKGKEWQTLKSLVGSV